MNYADIPLARLVVNPDNDRHGPVGSEQDAVNWLFENHGDKMLSLANDIVSQGRVFDSPLVKKVDGRFVVFDGNRRVACLKILGNQVEAPGSFASKFLKLRALLPLEPSATISCQLEQDQDLIDQIVSRRHNGTDGGRGQLRWDTRAKSNHARRVGGTNQYPIAEAVEEFLHEQGYPHARDIKRSTLYRLISAKKRQKQFGIELAENGSLKLKREPKLVLEAFTKVADDILDKELTLKNVLNSAGVEQYMTQLEQQKLVGPEVAIESEANNQEASAPGTKPNKTPQIPKLRDTLIPKHDFGIEWTQGQQKIRMVWQELQFVLKFSRSEIAIPILLRTLIELSTEHALQKSGRQIKQSTLSTKVKHIAQLLEDNGHFSKSEVTDLERLLGQTKSPRELKALHRAVHSQTALPAKNDLIAIWTAFEKYILLCIKVSLKRV